MYFTVKITDSKFVILLFPIILFLHKKNGTSFQLPTINLLGNASLKQKTFPKWVDVKAT